jgi:predicted ATPase
MRPLPAGLAARVRAESLFVVTGGPGSGKTTLIDALAQAGYARSRESGRNIIQDQVTIGGRGLPWTDPPLFAELMLAREIETWRTLSLLPGPVFLDRGVPDVLGYLRVTNLPVPPHMERAAAEFRYNRRVFITPPWPEIYAADAERRQSLDEAQRTYEAMIATYTGCGYTLIEVPRMSVEARVAFVLAAVNPGT